MKSKSILIKQSVLYSYGIITGISTVTGILGYTIKDVFSDISCWLSALLFLGVFILLSFIIYRVLLIINKQGLSVVINGMDICVRNGDIFNGSGLKVIPFNERFDTKVDDIIISHDSLNGQMIDMNIDKIKDINRTIRDARKDTSNLSPTRDGDKYIYPLGRIIKYNDYLLLSMTHFDNQNRAYINIREYESMLSNMWDEIRRVYAGKKIIMPLIGSGITTINGMKEKNNTVLLKCMLCTLKRSKFKFKNGIEIVLTQDTINNMDLVRLKEEFKNGV
ncbi:MAG: DUF6430 domain-containing protein [Bacilli bacterium]|nr:DUF6430 domain-containing protein [Bacilli bacterium]